MIGTLDSHVPGGPIEERWTQHKFDMKLVAPNNRRKFDVIIVGSGLAGASAAATLGEQGYNVKVFTYHDSPRRAHSIAAQGGINAAKNYKGDGDSVHRLFYDTVKGGDFRSRERTCTGWPRCRSTSSTRCVAQGVPFAREYGGLLDNRSFGGAQVSRTFYARGQTGQQLLLGAYQQMMHQVHAGTVELHTRSEMLDLVVKDGVAVRDRRPRPRHRPGHPPLRPRRAAVHRRLRQRLLPLDQRQVLQRVGVWRAHRRGRAVRQPLLHADPPHLHPGQRRVPVEAHADVGVAPQRRPHLGAEEPRRDPLARPDPRGRARLLPRAEVPELRQPRAPRRRVAQRQDDGRPGPGRRSAQERRVPRLRRRHRARSARARSTSATGTSSRCTSASPTRTR